MTQTDVSHAAKSTDTRFPGLEGLDARLKKCRSVAAVFQETLATCRSVFPALIVRGAFDDSGVPAVQMQHDQRMARSLAERFSSEYMAPLAEEVCGSVPLQPKLKRFERGEHRMTLVAAPVPQFQDQAAFGTLALMFSGDGPKAEVLLPALHQLARMVSFSAEHVAVEDAVSGATEGSVTEQRPSASNDEDKYDPIASGKTTATESEAADVATMEDEQVDAAAAATGVQEASGAADASEGSDEDAVVGAVNSDSGDFRAVATEMSAGDAATDAACFVSDTVSIMNDGSSKFAEAAVGNSAATEKRPTAQSESPAVAESERQSSAQPAVTDEPERSNERSQSAQEAAAIAQASRFGSVKEFAFAVANSLCGQIAAEQVFFGVVEGDRVQVEAVSGIPDFKGSSPGIVIARQAMEECIDASAVIVAQAANPDGIESLPIHRQWSAASSGACVCSFPLLQGNDVTGVISVRRPSSRPFRGEELEQLRQTLAPYGAAVRIVERANRSVGLQLKTAVADSAKRNLARGATGRKVFLGLTALALLWFLFGSMTYRPLCRTRVTSADLRHFSAPFDGKLLQVHVRPGQQVKQGELLAEFDTVDLRLQLNGLTRQISASQVELREAIAKDDLSNAALARAKAKVLKTQAAAVQKRIEDARIVAPGDGTVVLSDLEQRIGQIFRQGDEILQLAAGGGWLLEIEVPDDIVSYVTAEQVGSFAAASAPTEKQSFVIQHIDGAATVVADRNVFIARAPLESSADWLKTGMEGTARIDTVSRPVWWVTLHRAVDWARTNFWL